MERSVALKKLGRLLGKGFGYRIDGKASTPEQKAEARLQIKAAREEKDKLNDLREARFQTVLAGDPEYQRLKAGAKVARERAEELQGIIGHHKFTVGSSNGMFFVVTAQADSWEEIFEQLAKKKVA